MSCLRAQHTNEILCNMIKLWKSTWRDFSLHSTYVTMTCPVSQVIVRRKAVKNFRKVAQMFIANHDEDWALVLLRDMTISRSTRGFVNLIYTTMFFYSNVNWTTINSFSAEIWKLAVENQTIVARFKVVTLYAKIKPVIKSQNNYVSFRSWVILFASEILNTELTSTEMSCKNEQCRRIAFKLFRENSAQQQKGSYSALRNGFKRTIWKGVICLAYTD